MKYFLTLLVSCLPVGAFPNAIQHSRWTTNADNAAINGALVTNIPQAGVVGLTGAYQPASTTLTNFDLVGTNFFYPRSDLLQAGSANLTNWSLLSTNAMVGTNTFVVFTNTLGSAALFPRSTFQATNVNLTAWALYSTNAFYRTNQNLQAGSTTLSNFASLSLGTNTFIFANPTVNKGQFPIFNGTNWTYQSIPAGSSVGMYNVSSGTGFQWVSVVPAANLGSGSSLDQAVLYRDGIWRVPTATTNGTNITIFDDSQFTTNVNSQVGIKSGVSLTNAQLAGVTAMSTFTSSGGQVGNMTNTFLSVEQSSTFGDDITVSGSIDASLVISSLVGSFLSLDSTTNVSGSGFTNFVKSMFVPGANITFTTNANKITIAASGGGGSQTPWTSDINADSFSVTNIGGITFGSLYSFGAVITNSVAEDFFKIQKYDDTGMLAGELKYTINDDFWTFNRSVHITGDVNATGKGTFSGGIDPPYVLYDAHTRSETKTRVLVEVPPAKQTGAALFWNPSSHKMEIYVASEDKFYDLQGNELAP